MPKLLSIIVLILAIILFPPATLAFISQNAIPGDSTYPIKRKLEDIILAAVSFHPTTKAWFSVTEADRRFAESTALLAQGKMADTTLVELVSQTSAAVSNISAVSDSSQQQKLQQDLKTDVGKYIQVLSQQQQMSENLDQIQPTGKGTNDQIIPSETPNPTSNAVSQSTPTHQSSPTPNPSSVASPSIPPITSPVSSSIPIPISPPQDPTEICKHLSDDKNSLNQTLKQLCGINSQIKPAFLAPAISRPKQQNSDKNSNDNQKKNTGGDNQSSSRKGE